MRKVRRFIVWTVAAAVLGGVIAVWAGFGGWSRITVSGKAKQAFRASRPGDPRSYEFLARGIHHGMSAAEVDAAMSSAHESYRHMRREDPPREGFVNIYVFRFGPPWRNVLAGRAQYLYNETYWVYFDDGGCAYKLIRMAKTDELWPDTCLTIDLKREQVKPGLE